MAYCTLSNPIRINKIFNKERDCQVFQKDVKIKEFEGTVVIRTATENANRHGDFIVFPEGVELVGFAHELEEKNIQKFEDLPKHLGSSLVVLDFVRQS